ncbi:MAG: PilZ domain-containing protein [Candidatus Omnitrophica bacterium]|nr:PilZ domain-containing protein [Candidatus Omnitrophota bacterium]
MSLNDWFKPKWDERRFPRLRSYCLIKYSKISEPGAKEAKEVTNIRDISVSGLQFASYEAFPKNTLLDVKVNLPDMGEPLGARARVVWSKKVSKTSESYRVGVIFLDLSEADRKAIERHIQDAASDETGKKLLLGRSFLQKLRGLS